MEKSKEEGKPVEEKKEEGTGEGGKKKRKRKKKKKNKKKIPRGINLVPVDEYCKNGQSYPPSKTVASLYPDNNFPVCEIMPHPVDGVTKLSDPENIAREKNLLWHQRIQECREAAEIHRQVRQDAQRFIQPGKTLIECCEYLEKCNLRLMGFDRNKPLERSWGFPTGCSINHCAAHFTPNPGDKTVLKATDVVKFDFGTQINGHIIDCAWSMSFDPMHDGLMEAVKEATNTGIKKMGVGARFCEIGAAIQETMESHEVEYNGKTYTVKAIRNLNGHSIGQYRIHAGNTVPIINNGDQTKMEEGEMYAIETFGSTGMGQVMEDGECSHYMRDFDSTARPRGEKPKQLLRFIENRFSTLAFCRRWLQDEGQTKHLLPLRQLCQAGIVNEYPPLCDKEGCYTAQYEHTILLKPTSKEVLSRGLDY